MILNPVFKDTTRKTIQAFGMGGGHWPTPQAAGQDSPPPARGRASVGRPVSMAVLRPGVCGGFCWRDGEGRGPAAPWPAHSGASVRNLLELF